MARILLIDDDDDLRHLLDRILTTAGHEVTAFGSGRDALAAADAAPFDLVLTDVLMPDMDGVEILRAFVKRSPRPRLIVMTGGSSMLAMDFLQIAPSLGADGVLAKPFRAAELLAAIARVLAPAPPTSRMPAARLSYCPG